MINTKIRSKRGATLIFSLVALAVAVIVCAVVIYAAESNAGRIRSAQAAEQAQLTLNSAASLVRKEYAGNSIKMVNTYTTVTSTSNGSSTVTQNPSTVSVIYSDTDRNNTVTQLATGTYAASALTLTDGLSDLQSILLNWALDVMTQKVATTDACVGNYVIKAVGSSGALQDVNVKIRMEPGATADLATEDQKDSHDAEKYYLTAVFTVKDYSAETITMSFMATVSENTKSRLVSKTSSTAPAEDGTTITISRQEVETQQTLELSWNEANVVVNVADRTGG